MTDLATLINAATVEAELDSGVSPAWLAAQYGPQLHAEATTAAKAPPWTQTEDDFLRDQLGWLSIEEIAARLGRTPVAVELRWKRDLSLPAPSKHPDYLTAHQAAHTLGIDGHTIIKLIERGLLPGRTLPGERGIRVIRRVTLYRWAINPDHWPYLLGAIRNTERIRDAHLRRLIERQKERWADEWWTPGQVARYHHLAHSNLVNLYIRTGRLPALQWGNWHIKRSDAIACCFFTGKGGARASGYEQHWPEDLDGFLLLATAVGCWLNDIAQLTGRFSGQQLRHRLLVLHQSGRIPVLLYRSDLTGVLYNPSTGQLLADWQQHRARFPTLARALRRFVEGADRPADARLVIGVLRAWAGWQADPAEPSQLRLVRKLTYASNATPAYARGAYDQLRQWGIDPLGGL